MKSTLINKYNTLSIQKIYINIATNEKWSSRLHIHVATLKASADGLCRK